MTKHSGTFQFSYTFTYSEYKQIYWRLFLLSPGNSWTNKLGAGFYLAFLAGMLTIVVRSIFSHLALNYLDNHTIGLFGFYFVFFTVISFFSHTRKYKVYAEKILQISVNLGKKQIIFSDKKKENIKTLHKKDVDQVGVDSTFVYIAHQNGLRYCLPKRCFTDSQIQALSQTFNS